MILACFRRRFSTSVFRNMTKTALVIISEGTEEMEAVITIDVLRRGGVKVTVAGLQGSQPVQCSREVWLKPDVSLTDASKTGPYDALVLPGGLKGAQNFAEAKDVGSLLTEQEKSGGICAAICAAPIAFKSHGIAKNKQITSHPGVKEQIQAAGCYTYSEDRVVHDGNIVTSRGPGTAFEFALKLVEVLEGFQKVNEIVPPMLLKC